jgi:hypothetical protein
MFNVFVLFAFAGVFPIPRGVAHPLTPRILFSFFVAHVIASLLTTQPNNSMSERRPYEFSSSMSNTQTDLAGLPADLKMKVADFLSARKALFLSVTFKSVDLSLSALSFRPFQVCSWKGDFETGQVTRRGPEIPVVFRQGMHSIVFQCTFQDTS